MLPVVAGGMSGKELCIHSPSLLTPYLLSIYSLFTVLCDLLSVRNPIHSLLSIAATSPLCLRTQAPRGTITILFLGGGIRTKVGTCFYFETFE
jgi:hypothetical protein